ncbi:MAG: sporulation protein YabP [Clostridia bacterium]|nr:sporulation protein YabP [Clostridia bacterium]
MTELQSTPHQVVIHDRKQMTVSGVCDVNSFDDSVIVAKTALGELTVRGDGLQICRLNVDSGDLSVDGHIDSLEYTAIEPRKGRRFARWFR